MKVLFFSINNSWTPHFETELELMLSHIKSDDEVYVLTCGKKLRYCSSEKENNKINCINCFGRFMHGIELIGLSKKKIFYVKNAYRYYYKVFKDLLFINVTELKKFKFLDFNIGQGVASSIISELRDHEPDTIKYQNKIIKMLITSACIYDSVCSLLTRLRPVRFYIFNGRFFDSFPAIAASKKLGVDFYIHERGANFNKYILEKNVVIHSLSFLNNSLMKAWSLSKKDEDSKRAIATKWFENRMVGIDQNWTSFIKNQKKQSLPSLFNHKRKNVVFFNSSQDEFAAIPGWGLGIYKNEVDALFKISTSFRNNPEIMFYLRVHPNLKGLNNSQIKHLRQLGSLSLKNLKIIWPESDIDSYMLLCSADKVVVFYSTIGVESCYLNKPTILLNNTFYKDLGCFYLPKNHDEVVRLILSDLKPKPAESAFKYAFWAATRGIDFKFFQPNGFFGGKFQGQKIKPKYTLFDRFYFKLIDLESCWYTSKKI